ncbi:MAG: hypothetical protein QF864_12630 [SAR202 cluster bacterium]|jgi:hypothetical protein|nr:hypothetical protein [SAR202 cluster bacterium]
MNVGERDELLVQMKLIALRDSNATTNQFGQINDIGFPEQYKSLPSGFHLESLLKYSDQDLKQFANTLGINKAGILMKADTIINKKAVSIKSNKKAPPALVNHTTRPGFEFAALHSGGSIDALDQIINDYWMKRKSSLIGEDVKNSSKDSPFVKNKSILYPFLNFFLFKGTGSRLSKMPAEIILSFTDPFDTATWSIYDETNAVNVYWEKLIFSVRAKKGMPAGYPIVSAKMMPYKSSIEKWTEFIDGDYRGALHIRSVR